MFSEREFALLLGVESGNKRIENCSNSLNSLLQNSHFFSAYFESLEFDRCRNIVTSPLQF